jgi:hypothetical protein
MRYNLYNITMHIVHCIIILVSIFGFIYTDYLVYYLIFQFLILCSWLGYGLYDKRWGRCIITEIQWNIKESFNLRPETESYIQYWLKYKFGISSNETTVEKYIIAIYSLTFIIGIALYIKTLL